MPRGPNPRLDNYYAANQLFNQGATRFSGAMDKYSARIQNRANSDAVSNLLGVEASGTPNDYRGALGAVDTGYAQADKVLSATNSLLTPYSSQYNSDRSNENALARIGIAQSGLGERIRHNTAMENKPSAAGMPNIKTIEDVNPYTGAKSYYQYNSKDATPTFTPVDMSVGPQSSNAVVNTNAQPKVASAVTEQPGAYEANYIAQAEANPIDVGMAGAQVAGPVTGAGTSALPQTPGITFGKADRYGVSMGSNGTFRDSNGNYVIPLKMRELKEIQAADGSSSFVVVNKATGNDASGNPVGDAVPEQKLGATIALPTGQNVYVDNKGTPYRNEQGQYLVNSVNEKVVEKNATDKGIRDTMRELDDILLRVERNPDSVGSMGSGLGNWVGNQIQDIVKAPTEDRLNRNQIEAKGGVIAAGLRKGVESGVMTESDFDRYMKLVPNVDDSPQEALYKGQQLMRSLFNQHGILPQGYKRQYNQKTGEYRLVRSK